MVLAGMFKLISVIIHGIYKDVILKKMKSTKTAKISHICCFSSPSYPMLPQFVPKLQN
jgi:hypothetical protein